jgi:hypothetical protein
MLMPVNILIPVLVLVPVNVLVNYLFGTSYFRSGHIAYESMFTFTSTSTGNEG